ncbi:hypothetical protein PIB30_030972 [Stylosanthes scabra]|uniref:Ubiquitin-like protease family profile domain-containing protein n=1 Tax=Stylosanthes scabra TaxID=79078 RepID=A0ABU6TBH7_9FABA|nr:hypothetical protein [Stylosanthes scabra]
MADKGKESLTNFVVCGRPVIRSGNAKLKAGSVRGRGGRSGGKLHSEADRRRSVASGALNIVTDPRLVVHHNGRKLNRKLNCNSESDKSEEWSNVAQEDIGSPFTYVAENKNYSGIEMPWCFNLIWRPPRAMLYCGAELAVAAYIFNADLDINFVGCYGTREVFHSLAPGEDVHEDLINMVVGKLALEEDNLHWFLLTSFGRMALHPEEYDATVTEQMRDIYMEKYEKVGKVYIPLVRNDQWFLLVIDTTTPGSITYLNSCGDPKERKARINQVNYAAYFLETILDDKEFFEHSFTNKPLIS